MDFLGRFGEGLPLGSARLPIGPGDGIVRALPTTAGSMPPFAAVLASRPPRSGPLVYGQVEPGRPAKIVTYPAETVGVLPKAWLADKVVLIGATLPLDDRFATPFTLALGPDAGQMPGVMIHAHALAQLQGDVHLEAPAPLAEFGLAFGLSGLSVLALSLPLGLAIRGLLVAAAALGYGALLVAAYQGGWMLPFTTPEGALLLAAGWTVGREWKKERDTRQFLRNAFEKYVSPKVVGLLVAQPERLNLGGERRQVTYLFTDLAGFTSLTEGGEPQVLRDVLGRYMDGLTELAVDHGATLDKIIGDAMVCLFGAPLDQADHAPAALRLARAVDAYGERFRAEETGISGLTVGITRIGVHSGPAVVGNFGGKRFFDYTGLGDTVNTAARLESLNKHLGTRLAVSEATVLLCPEDDRRDLIPLGRFAVKGKSETLGIFAPASSAGVPDEDGMETYRSAYRHLDGNPTLADRELAGLEAKGGSGIVKYHRARLAAGETGHVVVMTQK